MSEVPHVGPWDLLRTYWGSNLIVFALGPERSPGRTCGGPLGDFVPYELVQGHLAHKKTPTPWDPPRTLGTMALLLGTRLGPGEGVLNVTRESLIIDTY